MIRCREAFEKWYADRFSDGNTGDEDLQKIGDSYRTPGVLCAWEGWQGAWTAIVTPVWQPIETAQQDGYHVLLYRPDICFVGYYAAGGEWIISAPGLPPMNPPPTHWQPLPQPPEKNHA